MNNICFDVKHSCLCHIPFILFDIEQLFIIRHIKHTNILNKLYNKLTWYCLVESSHYSLEVLLISLLLVYVYIVQIVFIYSLNSQVL